MKTLQHLFSVSLLIGIFSCSESGYKKFINKYNAEDFSPYINTGIVIRGHDNKDHSLVLFIDIDLYGVKNDGPYIVRINKESRKVIGTSTHLMADTSNLDSLLLQKLALKFVTYHINSLKVDLKGNVFIGIENSDKPDLIRFATKSGMPDYNRNDWVKMKDNWYKRR